jgi:Ca2+/Na+ antiporter
LALKGSGEDVKTAKQRYENRQQRYDKLLQLQKRTDRKVSNLRLIAFVVGICSAIAAYIFRCYTFLAVVTILFLVVFIYLVVYQDKLINRIKYTTLLLDINKTSIKRVNGEWNSFADAGEDFLEDSHNYTSDLDIFGKGSLFQWISAATIFTGREKLRDLLTFIEGSRTDICEREEAVEELAMMLNWRQRFSAEGMTTSKKIDNPEELIAWGEESNEFYRKTLVIAVIRICPIITILLVTAGFIMNIIPRYLPSIALLIQFILVTYNSRDRHRMFNLFENYSNDLRVYFRMLKHFETRKYRSVLINRIKKGIRSKDGIEAFKQIDKLSAIVDSLANRRNMFYSIFNTLTLWDFQGMVDLEKWKQQSGNLLKDWFDALGMMEALASLSIIQFENPDWVMPNISDRVEALFKAKDLGHPLLVGRRVCNDLRIDEKTRVLLITGSNMSGKSTLLRTAGINLVLAYAGAPVCAGFFVASIMEIATCMRIKDNLEENISSFYAELLRIKRIIGEAGSGKRVFFLLDEIFKGTNSHDRHAGARVLIDKLSHTNSIGMVSTHDIELCDLEKKNDKIANYHFQEYYEEGKINFDYILRQGSSTTRNAFHLMRLAGIEVDEDTGL